MGKGLLRSNKLNIFLNIYLELNSTSSWQELANPFGNHDAFTFI